MILRELSQGEATLHRAEKDRHGYLTENDVQCVAGDPKTRLAPLLVKCGSCRFVAPAQDIAHLIECVEKSGLDYVRDISIPAKETK